MIDKTIHGAKTIYTVGHKQSYDKGIKDRDEGVTTEFKKLGKTSDRTYLGNYEGDYPGGSVWQDYKGAKKAADEANKGYSVYELEEGCVIYHIGDNWHLEQDAEIIREAIVEYAKA